MGPGRLSAFSAYAEELAMDRAVRESYRAYVTDALVAPVLGSVPRWYDSVHPRAADARTGDEIARDVMCRAGLELVE